MTSALAQRSGLPGTLREDGYDLPPDLTFDEWRGVLDTLQSLERSVKWWIGDALLYGEAHFGEDHAQALPDAIQDATGYASSTLRQAAWVSSRFPPVTRVADLSWSHHRAVLLDELPIAESRALLKDAVESKEAVPVRSLIDRAHQRREQLRGRSVTADGTCAAEEPEPLHWVPVIEDLTDEARAALEAHAPGGRHRLGYVAGFLRALVYADQQDCFLPGRWRL